MFIVSYYLIYIYLNIGDSGGPLMAFKNGVWYLYGLTSFGDKSCDPTMPSYYTKVTIYLDWILSHTNEDIF